MIGFLLLTLLAPPNADHRDAVARYGAAVLKSGRAELVAAQNQLESAAKLDPQAAAPLRALIPVYLDLGRDPAAERAARRVLELDPDDAATGLVLGKLLLAVKKPKEAAAVLSKAAVSPRLAKDLSTAIDVFHELARAAEGGGDFPAAEAALAKRLDLLRTKKGAVARSTGVSTEDVERLIAETWERLGSVRVGMKQWDDAASAFQSAAAPFGDPAAANDPAAAARLQRNLARTAAARSDFAAAVKYQGAYLAAKAPGLTPLTDYAKYLRQAGRDAVAELARLAELNPRNDRLKWALAAERGRANFAAATQAKTELLGFASGSTEPELFALVADYFVTVGRPEEALDWAEKTFDTAKGEAYGSTKQKRMTLVAEAILANPALAKGIVLRAATDLRSGTKRSDGAWEFVAWLGERTGQSDVAGDAAVAALHSGNTAPEVVRQAFHRLDRGHRYPDLDAACDQYLRLEPRGKMVFTARVTKARALAELGRDVDALSVLRQAGEVDWNNDGKFGLRIHQIRIMSILGRYAEAAAEGEKVLAGQTRPYDVAQVRYVLSDAYLGLKQFDKAEAELRAVLEVDPDDVLALNNLGYHLADEGRKLPEAEDLIRRAIALDRDDRARAGNPVVESGVYLDSLGWALFRRGKLAEARATFEQALTFADGVADPVVWDHYGDVLFKLGEKEKAKAAWRKAEPGYVVGHQGRQGGRKEELARKIALVP